MTFNSLSKGKIMKLIINTKTLINATNESIAILKDFDSSLKVDLTEQDLVQHIVQDCAALKHYSASVVGDELVFEMSDELLFKAIRSYARIAGLVLPVVKAVKGLLDGLKPFLKSEVESFNNFAAERIVVEQEPTTV
jgi:hypothetical protein